MRGKQVSIIVPVYNAEDDLDHCISSILQQTYPSIDVILVNDGSTDNSGAICETYAKAYDHIQVIHQSNAGPSAARNRGIAACQGHYVQFVDADDTIDALLTEYLVETMANNVDFVICGYRVSHHNYSETVTPSITGVYAQEALLQYIGELYKTVILPSPCNKLYNRHVIRQQNIYFDTQLTVGEDLQFNLAYLNGCEHIAVINAPFYDYHIHDESLTQRYQSDFLQQQSIMLDHVRRYLQRHQSWTRQNQDDLNIVQANGIVNGLSRLFAKQNPLSMKQRKHVISAIIRSKHSETANFQATIQSRFVGSLIHHHNIQALIWFFKLKMFLYEHMQLIYYGLKRFNRVQRTQHQSINYQNKLPVNRP